jgi:antitoxin CptB
VDERRIERARLRAWRRGFREADLILGPFADANAGRMTADDLTRFEALLEQGDHDLYAWIVGTAAIPAEFDHEVMAALRASALAGPAARGG